MNLQGCLIPPLQTLVFAWPSPTSGLLHLTSPFGGLWRTVEASHFSGCGEEEASRLVPNGGSGGSGVGVQVGRWTLCVKVMEGDQGAASTHSLLYTADTYQAALGAPCC